MKILSLNLKNAFLILLSAMMFTACNSDEETATSELIGKWTLSSSSFDATINGVSFIEYMVDAFQLSEADAAIYADLLQDELVGAPSTGTIEFKTDNTYSANFDGSTDTGTWSISSDNKKLTVDAGTEDATTFDVVTLTSSSLKIKFSETQSEDIDDDTIPETIEVSFELSLTK